MSLSFLHFILLFSSSLRCELLHQSHTSLALQRSGVMLSTKYLRENFIMEPPWGQKMSEHKTKVWKKREITIYILCPLSHGEDVLISGGKATICHKAPIKYKERIADGLA